MFEELVSGAVGVLGSIASAAGQVFVNERNQRFTRHMASSQYQRSVADMRNAGLNPSVLFGAGGGAQAAAPQGQMENPLGQTGSTAKNALEFYTSLQMTKKLAAEVETARAVADKAKAEAMISVKEAGIINNALDDAPAQSAAISSRYGNSAMGTAASLLALGKNPATIWGGNATARSAVESAGPALPYNENDPYFKRAGANDWIRWYNSHSRYEKERILDAANKAELERLRALKATTGKGSSAKQRQERDYKEKLPMQLYHERKAQ